MSVIMTRKPRRDRTAQGTPRERSQSVVETSMVKYMRNRVRANEEKNLMRKSLCDYQREKLEARNAVLYTQRLFIFAKNLRMTVGIQPRTSQIAQAEENVFEEEEDESQEGEEVVVAVQRQSSQMELPLLNREDLERELRTRLEDIVKRANSNTLTDDELTGLFLFMGTYSLIVVEGTEDANAIFCEEFQNRFSEFWANNKVFLVEDNVTSNYFDSFICKATLPININEKFPPNSGNDEQIMRQQHAMIKKKLHMLCSAFTVDSDEEEDDEEEESVNEQETETDAGQIGMQLDFLKNHIPEVQRIELVLESTRFYRCLNDFAHTYNHIMLHPDDEDVCWPVRNNYTPYGVYLRSEYDYNLTYPESNITSEQKSRRASQMAGEEEEEEGDEEEQNEGEAAEQGA